MSDKVTAPRLRAMKERSEKIVCVTAYDVGFGRLADEAGVDLVLVGDSLGNVLLGYDTTLPVTLDQVAHHVAATRRGVSRAFLVGDLPFGSYQSSVEQCVNSSVALMKAGADGVKLEGPYYEEVAALVKAGIPVIGHLGMTPQSVNQFGGFRVQGRGEQGTALREQARMLQEAGCFAIVLELVPGTLASEISGELVVPTIGIGAGPGCDGEIQVLHDVLGLSPGRLKHARPFVDGHALFLSGLKDYVAAVRGGEFPGADNTF